MKLAPCPKCKSAKRVTTDTLTGYAACCGDCYDGEPLTVYGTKDAAIEAWNEKHNTVEA